MEKNQLRQNENNGVMSVMNFDVDVVVDDDGEAVVVVVGGAVGYWS